MPPAPPALWSFSRKLAGNLVPLLFSAPLFVLSMIDMAHNGATAKAAWLGLGFLVVGWLGTNFLGLWGNGPMKRQFESRFRSMRPDETAERFFVGFARPTYKGLLDPHEDVGFLVLGEAEIEFWGDSIKIEMPWSVVKEVRRSPNIHTWLGLGGWICIEGEVAGKTVRMLCEVREEPTLWANRRYSKTVLARLQDEAAKKGVPAQDEGQVT